jgi:hypothetical protein
VTRDSIGDGQRSRIKIGMRVITANGDDLTKRTIKVAMRQMHAGGRLYKPQRHRWQLNARKVRYR